MASSLQSAQRVPCLPRTIKTTRTTARVTPTIDTVAEKLNELKKQCKKLAFTTWLPLPTYTEQTCITADDVLLGRANDRQSIIDMITAVQIDDRHIDAYYGYPPPHTSFVIFGPLCVGKTALLKSIYNDPTFQQDDYWVKVWVDMLKGWDIKEICTSIMKELRELLPDFAPDDYLVLEDTLATVLQSFNKRLLLVLDSLELDYGQEQCRLMLGILRTFLNWNTGGRVIVIVATRSQDIAAYLAGTAEHKRPHQLHPLSDDMCWEIIKQTSGLEGERTTAGNQQGGAATISEMTGREIGSKCWGLPLAAKALGRYLLQQSVANPQEWPAAIKDLQDDIWGIRGGFSRDSHPPIHIIIMLTHLMRSSDLAVASWLSFPYCAFAFFPKGKGHGGMVTRDLLNQWCSMGIAAHHRQARSCISELVGRSLLLREKPASVSTVSADDDRNWDAMLLTMDGFTYSFARYLLCDRLIVVDGKNRAMAPTSSIMNVNNESSSAYMALVNNFDARQSDISSILPARILALRFDDCNLSDDGGFAFFKYLRLLDLSRCSLKKLPGSIRHLKQLRYLNAPGIQDEVFPRPITGLHELRYLILHGSCQLSDLTEAFQRLSNLLHLDLSGCSGLKALPDSFGRLWRLEFLDLSASGIEALPESFGRLRNLRHLNLAGCSGLKESPQSLMTLNRLKHLDLSGCSSA